MTPDALLQSGAQALAAAKRHGATAADVLVLASTDMNAAIRHGAPETIERAESRGIGLRVFVGQSCATLSTSDLSAEAIERTAETAIAIAKLAPADPFAGLADAGQLATSIPTLEMADSAEPGMEQLQAMARTCEEAGRDHAGITNSEGADASFSDTTVALVTSHGFAQSYRSTRVSVACSLIAGSGETMQRDYAYESAVFLNDLPGVEHIGREAAQRTLARMNPRKIGSQNTAIVFDPRSGKQLLGAFAGAISGASIARGTSFLKDMLGQQLFAAGMRITDDPLRPRGLASHPFDAEGIAATARDLVHDGVLQSWLLDCRSARQLGLTTTGHASRGLTGAPHPASSNLYLAAGDQSPEEIMRSIGTGLYVTETIGHGTNLITGDYSVGASGFWIENGERTYPVSEITIAGNLKTMFTQLIAGNDLAFRYGTNVPTLCIPSMTIAGN